MNKKEVLTNLIREFYINLSNCCIEVSKELGSYDMQVKQFHYLQIINQNSDLTSSKLSEILNITKPSVTEIINKLIKLGCVYREQSSSDRRVFYIKLTEKGIKITKTRDLAVHKFAEENLPSLTVEEMIIFINLLNKISK